MTKTEGDAPAGASRARIRTGPSTAERVLFWLVVLAAALVHWIPRFPPQVDLPQHAAQIRFLHDWTHPDFPYRDILQLNLFTPYLPAYFVGAALMFVMSAVHAVQTLWSIAAFGTILCSTRIRRRLGGDAHWDWLLVPGLFGMTFQWGFLPFLFAIPCGLAALECWLVFRQSPSRKLAIALSVMLVLLFFAHSLVTAWVLAVCGMMLLADASEKSLSLRDVVRRAVPLLAPIPVVGLWYLRTRDIAQTKGETIWDGYLRVLDFFPEWLGMPAHWTTTLMGVVLISAVFASGGRFDRSAARRAPIVITMAILIAGPNVIYGNAFTYNRFYTLFGPALVFAIASTPIRSGRAAFLRFLLPLGTTTCVAIIIVRMVAFADEQRGFVRIIERMAPAQPTVSLIFEASSAAMAFSNTYLHFPVWYQAERGGLVQPSFSAYLPTIVHFREGYVPAIPFRFESNPMLRWEQHRGREFAYFVARSTAATSPLAGQPVTLAAHDDAWWLYEQRRSAP